LRWHTHEAEEFLSPPMSLKKATKKFAVHACGSAIDGKQEGMLGLLAYELRYLLIFR